MKNYSIRDFIFVCLLLSTFTNEFSAQETNSIDLNKVEIILLGEQTHGDGAVFDKKVALIKEHHEKDGFNIVVFESGLYDNYKAMQMYQSGEKNIDIYNLSIYSMWADTQAFQNLLEYISQNPEMKLLGFDCQEGGIFNEYYFKDLKQIFEGRNFHLSEEEYATLESTMVFMDLDPYINNETNQKTLYSLFEKVLGAFSQIPDKTEFEKVMVQTFKSKMAEVKYTIEDLEDKPRIVQNPRDAQMAKNLIFLKELYPNEKIIGWGASYHFANQINSIDLTSETENYMRQMINQQKDTLGHIEENLQKELSNLKELKKAVPMGQILKSRYGNRLYSLAFSSYSGAYKGNHGYEFEILTPSKNSFESVLHGEGNSELWVDLKNFQMTEYYTSTLGYLPLLAKWNQIYDGIYYIPVMYLPAEREYKTSNLIISNSSLQYQGVLKDADNNIPIAGADVYFSNNNQSTITNSDGGFSISGNEDPNAYLVFSAFNYVSDSIQIKDIKSPLEILLKPIEENMLSEVTVVSIKSLDVKDILKKARENIEKNYVQTPFNQEFFYNIQKHREPDSLTYDESALINMFFEKGNSGSNSPENHIYGVINKYGFNVNTTKGNELDRIWTTIIRNIILNKSNILYRPNAYDAKIDKVTQYDGRQVYIISFTNSNPNATNTGYGYPAPICSQGYLYIDKETYAVLKYEHCVTRQMFENKRSKYKFQSFHHITETYKEVDGKYFLNVLSVTDKTDFYTKDNKEDYVVTTYKTRNLISQNIETRKVQKIEKPLPGHNTRLNLQPDAQFISDYEYLTKEVDYKFENCRCE